MTVNVISSPTAPQARNFIVFQYGKVGSTSVTSALNAVDHFEAHQTHFLGEKSFTEMLQLLLNPERPEYFFEHSAGQLISNLRIFRLFSRRDIDDVPLTLVSIAREPFDWFRSALTQDAPEHLASLIGLLKIREMTWEDDSDAVTKGLKLVFGLLRQAVEHYGSIDTMNRGARYDDLYTVLDHRGRPDFLAIMFFVNIFLRPHLWFHTQFSELMGFELADMEAINTGALRKQASWGNTYVLHYENLNAAMAEVMCDLGLEGIALPQENVALDKPFSAEIGAAFSSADALALKAHCHSADTRLLGYR